MLKNIIALSTVIIFSVLKPADQIPAQFLEIKSHCSYYLLIQAHRHPASLEKSITKDNAEEIVKAMFADPLLEKKITDDKTGLILFYREQLLNNHLDDTVQTLVKNTQQNTIGKMFIEVQFCSDLVKTIWPKLVHDLK